MNPTPDELSLQQAQSEGQRAGEMSLPPALNPYQDDQPEHDVWEKARLAIIGYRLNFRAALARSVY
jgi:hypothetical protein